MVESTLLAQGDYEICQSGILPCKAKMQYLLTLQASRYCLLALQNNISLWCIYCRSGIIREVLITRISRGGQIREFKNLAKIIFIIALLKKNENSQILNFVKSHKIRNSGKFEHAKITRSTVLEKRQPLYGDCLSKHDALPQCWVNDGPPSAV